MKGRKIAGTMTGNFKSSPGLLVLALVTLLAGHAWAQEDGQQPPLVKPVQEIKRLGPVQTVPEGAQVLLETDRKEFFLGENVLVDFILKNSGPLSFTLEFGGDYRGASRALRFKVSAVDEAGQTVADPDPEPMCMGGLGGTHPLEPGKTWTQSLALMRYCKIEKPGIYVIRASHDFGWTEGELSYPVGEIKIALRMPDPAQAEKLVEEMEKRPDDPNSTMGEAGENYADFSCLRWPVYLAPLSQRAWKGEVRALQGLGSMETSDATAELIKLLDHPDEEIVLKTALTLNLRLPDPEWKGELGSRGPFMDGRDKLRKELVRQSWDPKFVPDIRRAAAALLERSSPGAVSAGAFMMQSVGTSEDAPKVLGALERSLKGLPSRKGKDDNVLNPPEPVGELLRAMKMLGRRGFENSDPQTAGTRLAWLDSLPPDSARYPEHWEDRFGLMLKDACPLIREKAVALLPSILNETLRAQLRAAFSDEDLGVKRAACEWVAAYKDASFREEVLGVLRNTGHDWVFNSASNAAMALGAGLEVCEVCVKYLGNKDRVFGAMGKLVGILVAGNSGASGNTNLPPEDYLAIRSQWELFLKEHSAEIREGKKFKIGDPALVPEMFGRAYQIHLSDGTSWPKKQD